MSVSLHRLPGLFAGLLCLLAATAVRAEPPAVFTAFFDGLQTFRADFTQEVLDRHGERVQEGAGEMYIQRPGRFRWNYSEPYTQVILGDGTTLWTYDADLEQATRKPQQEVLMGTPAVLLSSVEDPSEVFRIAPVGGEGEIAWAELIPRNPDSQFEAIHLGFVDGMLRRMILHDSFGQRTDIRFGNAQRNVELDPGLFRFDPPPGTDILGGEG